jgi:hypothetical protein
MNPCPAGCVQQAQYGVFSTGDCRIYSGIQSGMLAAPACLAVLDGGEGCGNYRHEGGLILRDIVKPLLAAVGCFIVVKLALGIAPLNDTARLLITTVAAAIIAGLFTRHVRARKGGGQ